MILDIMKQKVNLNEIIPCSSLSWPSILTHVDYLKYHVICFDMKHIGDRQHWFLVPEKLSPENAIYQSCIKANAASLVRCVWSVLLNINIYIAGEESLAPITVYYPVWEKNTGKT